MRSYIAACLSIAACGTAPSSVVDDAGVDAPTARPDAGDDDATSPTTDAATAGWRLLRDPVFEGQYPVVGDPSIVRLGPGAYRMYHHCLDVERAPQGGEICLATSRDGLAWDLADTPESTALVRGRVLRAARGSWHEAHETPFAVIGPDTTLYFLGYRGAGFFEVPGSAGIGRSTSADGSSFEVDPAAVLSSGATAWDGFGITSPSIVRTSDGSWILYYIGWCTEGACAPIRLSLMRAVSADGSAWAADEAPLELLDVPPWTNGGVSEPEVVRVPDGRYLLFFTSLAGPAGSTFERQRIGIGVADDSRGPFRLAPVPIIAPEDLGVWARGGALAPSVLLEDSRVRVWFHGFSLDEAGGIAGSRIGYAEADLASIP